LASASSISSRAVVEGFAVARGGSRGDQGRTRALFVVAPEPLLRCPQTPSRLSPPQGGRVGVERWRVPELRD
jgi:hypothetical protein